MAPPGRESPRQLETTGFERPNYALENSYDTKVCLQVVPRAIGAKSKPTFYVAETGNRKPSAAAGTAKGRALLSLESW